MHSVSGFGTGFGSGMQHKMKYISIKSYKISNERPTSIRKKARFCSNFDLKSCRVSDISCVPCFFLISRVLRQPLFPIGGEDLQIVR